MTTWRYGLPPQHPGYPDPAPEIEHLRGLQGRGLQPYLLLARGEHPPGSRAEPGDVLLLCVRQGRDYVAVARASVVDGATRRSIPAGHEGLYDVGMDRWWLPVRIEMLPHPHTEEDLGLLEAALQRRGRAYLWRLES